jgi:hypothetical protein
MNWFQRHLNWSYFLAVSVVPGIIFVIFYALFFMMFYGALASLSSSGAGEAAIESYMLTSALPFVIIYFIAILGNLVWDIIITLWYLGQKARSKWLTFLLFAPFGFIILLLLENKAIGYGGDFGYEPATAGWSDGRYDVPEGRQIEEPDYTKELDYTPSQNVLDIAGGPPAKDVRSMGDTPDTGGGGAEASAGEEAPPEKETQRPVTYKRPSMPILLDDAGNVISCAYHPGADAVNLCSRCHQYVCAECNYITGTHPICRNCWERRTEAPLAPPSQKQARPAPSQPTEKQKVTEPAEPAKEEGPTPAEPEAPPVAEVAEPVEQIAAGPVEQMPAEPVGPLKQEAVAPAEPEEPPVIAAVRPEERSDIATAEPEEQEPAIPVKPAKQDAEISRWQQEFMAIYQQASPIINVIIRKGADGMPGSPLDLMEGLKLRPMLVLVKKLSKPKDGELREAKSELEQLLSSCIRIADAAADFVGGGGQALLGGPDFKRIVDGIEKASQLMEKLSQRLPAFSRPQE